MSDSQDWPPPSYGPPPPPSYGAPPPPPYGPPPPYPYGQPYAYGPAAPAGPPPAPPWGVTAQGEYTGPALALVFVLSILSLALCPVLIVGIVLSCMGLNRVKSGSPDAAAFMIGSWVAFGVGGLFGGLGVLAIVLT